MLASFRFASTSCCVLTSSFDKGSLRKQTDLRLPNNCHIVVVPHMGSRSQSPQTQTQMPHNIYNPAHSDFLNAVALCVLMASVALAAVHAVQHRRGRATASYQEHAFKGTLDPMHSAWLAQTLVARRSLVHSASLLGLLRSSRGVSPCATFSRMFGD